MTWGNANLHLFEQSQIFSFGKSQFPSSKQRLLWNFSKGSYAPDSPGHMFMLLNFWETVLELCIPTRWGGKHQWTMHPHTAQHHRPTEVAFPEKSGRQQRQDLSCWQLHVSIRGQHSAPSEVQVCCNHRSLLVERLEMVSGQHEEMVTCWTFG